MWFFLELTDPKKERRRMHYQEFFHGLFFFWNTCHRKLREAFFVWELMGSWWIKNKKERETHTVWMPHNALHMGLERSKLTTAQALRLSAVNLLKSHVWWCLKHVSDISVAAGVPCLIAYTPCGNNERYNVLSSSVRVLGSQTWWVCGNILWSASGGKGFYRSAAVVV